MLTETFDNVLCFWDHTFFLLLGSNRSCRIWSNLNVPGSWDLYSLCKMVCFKAREIWIFTSINFICRHQSNICKKTNKRTKNTQIIKPIPIEKANNSIENEGQKRKIINTYILYSGQVPFMVCPVYSKGKCFCKLGWGLHPLFPCIPSLVYGKLNVMWQWWLQSPEVCHQGHLYGASA